MSTAHSADSCDAYNCPRTPTDPSRAPQGVRWNGVDACAPTPLTPACLVQGVRWNGVDACAQHDPCQHGGIRISTDTGAACECRNLDFRGYFCEKGQ